MTVTKPFAIVFPNQSSFSDSAVIVVSERVFPVRERFRTTAVEPVGLSFVKKSIPWDVRLVIHLRCSAVVPLLHAPRTDGAGFSEHRLLP